LLYRLDVIYRYIDVAKEVYVATSSIRNDPPNPRDKDLRDTDLHEHDPHDKLAARIAIVEQHVRLENAHDLEGVLGIYTFDADNRLAGEKIYYDRGTVLRQLGVFHEPPSVLGQIGILVTHPITIARALARKVRGR
jgi:hypothetical protein